MRFNRYRYSFYKKYFTSLYAPNAGINSVIIGTPLPYAKQIPVSHYITAPIYLAKKGQAYFEDDRLLLRLI